MAGNPEAFAAGHQGAGGLIKPAVEREEQLKAVAKGAGAKNQRVAPTPKMVDQDSGQVTEGETIDEREIATSRGSFVKSGGKVGEPKIRKNITTPIGRDANSKEVLAKLQEHHGVISAHASTKAGSIQKAVDSKVEEISKLGKSASAVHGDATSSIGEARTHLREATMAFTSRNSAQGNESLKKASNALIKAHGHLNSSTVRQVTGGEVPVHIDDLKAWKSHTDNLPTFRRQGKPFDRVRVQMPNVEMKDGELVAVPGSNSINLRPSNSGVKEIASKLKGTVLGDKMARAQRGTPRTPKWERDEASKPSISEKGTGVIDTASSGTNAGTTGEMDPRRKASKKTAVRMTIAKPKLPDTANPNRPYMTDEDYKAQKNNKKK